MKLAIHQFNPTVGALKDNADKLITAINAAIDAQCAIFISSELALCGYIPKDLLFRPDFHNQIKIQLNRFFEFRGITLLIGAPHIEANHCYNGIFIIRDGQIIDRYDKQKLPNYDVFDECRYFTTATDPVVFECDKVKFGVIICEDTWHFEPGLMAKQAGAEILVSINASPFNTGKYQERLQISRNLVNKIQIPLIYVNQLGGQDDLVFDGASFVMDARGDLITSFPAFSNELNFVELTVPDHRILHVSPQKLYPDMTQAVYQALVLAVHDYIHKNGFKGVLLGLSGGIDSALTLAIAVDALGVDKVMAVMMPSQYTADISITDSRDMIQRLGVAYEEIEINPIFNQFKQQLAPVFANLARQGITAPIQDATEENLQARSRGVLLMALSNKLGYLVLTTGNKSEMAVGYATLYGDMAGGFAVLKDVPKTLVYKLSNWRNSQSQVIPERIITRPPSAELRENQTDQDALPDYDILDAIIELLVEQKLSAQQIIANGYDEVVVRKVARLIRLNEYKRSQAAVGPKITPCAFNNDWRYPITNRFEL